MHPTAAPPPRALSPSPVPTSSACRTRIGGIASTGMAFAFPNPSWMLSFSTSLRSPSHSSPASPCSPPGTNSLTHRLPRMMRPGGEDTRTCQLTMPQTNPGQSTQHRPFSTAPLYFTRSQSSISDSSSHKVAAHLKPLHAEPRDEDSSAGSSSNSNSRETSTALLPASSSSSSFPPPPSFSPSISSVERGTACATKTQSTTETDNENPSAADDADTTTLLSSSPSSSLPSFTITPSLAYLLLNIVTILWGSQHAIIKIALLSSPDSPGAFNFLRFGLASLCFLPWTPSLFPSSSPPSSSGVVPDMEEEERQGLWKAGAELGVWMFLGFALQALGLQYTSASRSGFLLYLNVKLVPLFAWLLLGRRPTLDVVGSALVAFLGTALLSFDGGMMPNAGDAWSLAAAAASAMFILRLEGAAKAYSLTRAKELNSATLWVTTFLCLGWVGVEYGLALQQGAGGGGMEGGGGVLELVQGLWKEDWRQIVYLGVVTSAVCNWIQTLGQREVPAEKAALIYALDPVYGAVFARVLLGESEALGVRGYVGAGLVTAAAVGASLWARSETKVEVKEEEEGVEMVKGGEEGRNGREREIPQ